MSIENIVPMSDFTEVTDIADTARIIGLQDNENVKIPLQSLIAKTLDRVDEDILTRQDINIEGGVTGFEPIGVIEKNNMQAVSGNDIFNFVSNAVEPILFKKGVSNLFDKNKIQLNRDLDKGKLEITGTSRYAVSEYIPVKANTIYSIWDWFDTEGSNTRLALFENVGDFEPIYYSVKSNFVKPEIDCYLVITIDRNTAFVATNTKVFENIGYINNSVFEPYTYTDKYINNFKQYNKLQNEKLLLGTINSLGQYQESLKGDLCTDFIEIEPASFIDIEVLGNENIKREYFFYREDKTLINSNYKSFVGVKHLFHIPSNAKYIRCNIKKEIEKYVLLENISLNFTPFKFKGINKQQVINVSDNFEYKVDDFVNRNNTINASLNTQFKITSNKIVKNALVILNLHKGSRPPGFSVNERHIHISNCQNDFSDVGITKNGKLLNIRKFAGNYELEPLNPLRDRMFQDKEDLSILGSNNGHNGLYKSLDFGQVWDIIRNDVRIVFMLKNNDILVQKGKEILLLKKSENYLNGKVVFTSQYASFIMDASSFTQLDNGSIFMGAYQNEFDTKIYRSTDNGNSFEQVFSNMYKQHIHKVWNFDNIVYATIDGATGVMENDNIPENRGMLNIYSTDNGNTWIKVPFNWTTDYGLNQMNKRVMYGSGECAVKYSPSLFRSVDNNNFDVIWKVPSNSQNIRNFDDNLIINTVAYGKFGHSKTFITKDGINMIPIFDTPTLNSESMHTALRYGTSDDYNSYLIDDKGNKFIALTSAKTDLGNYTLKVGGDNYQALVYMQCDLEIGENIFNIVNTTLSNDIIKNKDSSHIFEVIVNEDKTVCTGGIEIPHNNCLIGNGVYDSFMYPYKTKYKSRSGELQVSSRITRVNSIRFGYKNITSQDDATDLVLLDSNQGFKLIKRQSNIVLKFGESTEYILSNVFRTYYDNTCCDYLVSFENNIIKIYVNGVFYGSIDSSKSNPSRLQFLNPTIGNNTSNDLISFIKFYDYSISDEKAKELFNGFNII